MLLASLFKQRKPIFERLRTFGFRETAGSFTYFTLLLDGQFEMTVTVLPTGSVSAELLDVLTKEPYTLHHVTSAKGEFVGRVRTEYEGVLSCISRACFVPDVFKSEGAQQIIQHVRETYKDELEFLWERFPDNAVFRRKDSAKWYAALLTVQRQKLQLAGEGTIEIIDLRGKPEDIEALVDGKRYLPGYHMNKKHWLTICLDGSVPMGELFRRIDVSHQLAFR